MSNFSTRSGSAMYGSLGTSAHETGTALSVLSLDSNHLRFYTPSGTRRRKPSDTSAMRGELCAALSVAHAGILRIKIKDCGILFSARVWMRSGRIVHRKAYSLPNLAGMLVEGIQLVEGHTFARPPRAEYIK